MKSSVLVGCESIDAGLDFVRLREAGGSLRTIPWISIRAAALLNNDEHMTFEGDLSPVTKLRSTHEPLWMESGDNVDFVMLEKGGAGSEPILAAFRERLGARWLGDQFPVAEAAERMFRMPAIGGGGIPKVVIIAGVGMILIFVAALIIAKMAH